MTPPPTSGQCPLFLPFFLQKSVPNKNPPTSCLSLLPDPGHVATKNGTGGGGVGLCVRRIGDNGAWPELEVHFVLSKLHQNLKRYIIGRCWQRSGVWSKSKPAPWISHIRHDGRIRSVCTQRSQTGAFREPRPPAGSAHHGLPHILHQAQAEKS